MSAIQIRKASIEDAKAIRQIYASYVLNTAITYETSVPSVEEFQGRIARSFRRQGIGKALYEKLEKLLGEMGITNLYACIACPDTPDEYLDGSSIEFHRRQGFSLAGTFTHCANKFGRWYNMVWMEKFIGEHSTPPKEVRFANRK